MLDSFGPSGQTGPNKRGKDRRAVMIPATIYCPDGQAIACVLRDMSASGAKLAVSRRHRLPEAFTLVVPGRAHDYRVRRIWRRADFAGVTLDLTTEAEVDPAAG